MIELFALWAVVCLLALGLWLLADHRQRLLGRYGASEAREDQDD